MSKNKDVVQSYMDAYARWDRTAVLACLADDIEWVVPGAFHLVGKEAYDSEIEGHGAAGPPEIEVTGMTEEADVVVAEGTVRSTLEDGTEVNLVFCDVFRMREDKIRHLTSYLVIV